MSEYRSKAINKYGEECAECGATENIDVHHRDGDRTNNDIENLIPLCEDCHSERHDGYTFDSGGEGGLTQITVRLDGGNLAAIERVSEGTHRSRSDVIRDAVSEYLHGDKEDKNEVRRLEKQVSQLEEERDYLREIVRNLSD